MRTSEMSLVALSIIAVVVVAGCGDGNTTGSTPTTTTTSVVPAADIDVSGNGLITINPSLDTRFAAAVVFPIRIRETAGGSAIWNYFRVSYLRRGVEIERSEQGASDIRDAGYRDIDSNANVEVSVVARVNSTDFDDLRVTLGFIDKRDSRSFEVNLDGSTFDGVGIDLTPVFLPDGSAFTIVEDVR